MSTFRERLDAFVEGQRGKNEKEAQNNAHQFSQQLQEYAPKERWGNIFKYIIAYALGIGLGHALAAALVRGADGLAPSGIETEPLAEAVEDGSFDAESFDTFMTESGIESVDLDTGSFADADDMGAGDANVDGGEISVAGADGVGDLGDTLGSFLET